MTAATLHRPRRRSAWAHRRLAVAGLLCAGLCSVACAQNPPRRFDAMPRSAAWKNVDALIKEEKLEEASRAVAEIRSTARAQGNEPEITRAIISEVQLREALHGTETALRFLKAEAWPKGAVSRLTLQLYYAHALTQYLGMYAWEIGQRERVESKTPVDLKAWTRDQIVAEAARTYEEVWQRRVELGQAPIGQLSEYLQPNDYPAGVRDSLRDAVTYFAVALLADSGYWTAEQTNEVYRLDLAALLAPGAPLLQGVRLDDAAIHPLVRMVAALDDLERWHNQDHQPEGALEARLERLRQLHQNFSEAADRATIRKDLADRLPSHRARPWYAMAAAQLADFVRATSDLVAARAVAEKGAAAWPGHPGGLRCRAIIADIEAPDVQLAAMRSDGAGRRSLLLTHKNVAAVYLRAYAVDLFARVESARDYNLLPGYEEMRALARRQADAAWKVDLPRTPDYQSHKTWVVPPLSKKGLYVILASVREDFGQHKNRILGTSFILTDLVLVVRRDGSGDQQITAVSGASGRPLAGVELDLYRYDWQHRHSVAEKRATDAGGQFTFRAVGHDGSYFVVGRRGDDLALAGDNLFFTPSQEPPTRSGALVYTDRSIYRPLQEVQWKVVAFAGDQSAGDFHVSAGAALTVSLRDANGQMVSEQQVKTNSFGSAAGRFTIPAGRLLGAWMLQASSGGQARIRVEEYKRPTFEVSIKDPPGELRLNQPATLVGEARYYFGLPVTSGQVRYRVVRQPVYPWWWEFYYYGGGRSAAQAVATGSAEVGKDGTFKVTFTPQADERQAKTTGVSYRYALSVDFTDEGGETRSAEKAFRLGFVAIEASLALEGDSTFLTSDAKGAALTVRRADLNGHGRAGKGGWRLVELQQPAVTTMPAELPATDGPLDGEAGAFHTPGDALRPRWSEGEAGESSIHRWKDGAEKARGELVHDDSGAARLALPALAAGAFRVRYTTADAFGATYESFHDFVVAAAGAATPLAVPALLLAQRSSVSVGDSARFLVTSGLPDQALFFEVYKQGRLQERRRLDGRSKLVEIPIKAADRGGFGVVLWAVRDHQLVQASRSVMVPWEDKELKLDFATFRDTLRPGARETFRVTVRGASGKVEAGSAEVLAYMFDRSLDYFAPHNPPSPLSLYPSRTGVAASRASLGQSSALALWSEALFEAPAYHGFNGDRLKLIGGYGVGGLGVRRRGFGGGPGAAPMPMAPMAASAAPAREANADGALRKQAGKGSALDAIAPEESGAAATEPKARAAAAEPVRQNFAETAFFSPQLISDGQGQAVIEFTVPDSVTSWNVWVHAITRDLRAGSQKRESRSVKELMVRPYLPRFFREGDRVDLKVMVQNASDRTLAGKLVFELFDPQTDKSLAGAFGLQDAERQFAVEKDGGQSFTFAVTAPRRVGPVAVRATARSGDFSDGELRPLPVLPGRMHLAQSRFVTLHDQDKRSMTFADLARGDDPSLVNEQLVVTVDAQLFYTVLNALPYLVEYPYECTEQTLNRFVSTGIVSSVFKLYPAVARMAEQLSRRTTRLPTWDAADPNRKVSLEETPWLLPAHGGADATTPLVNVLDPRLALAQRQESLARLQKLQTAIGGFPWFPGGPPSPFMTLYLMYGFAKAAEFGVEVPKEMVQRGWQYLALHYRNEYMRHLKQKDGGWEFLTFLNYAAGAYPDDSWTGGALTDSERKEILDFSFAHWKQHTPYLKALLALTLKRMGRPQDATLVFDSVMDSARTLPDQGTFWAQEDRSWLWYSDTTETHAMALRALMELRPEDSRKDGLVLWLLLDKKLNHWKSTRATAEVIYSLVKYMDKAGTLGNREEIKVSAPPLSRTFAFDPEQYVGQARLVIAGDQVDARTSSTITVEKATRGFAFASATWHFSTDKMPAEDRGDFFSVSRTYFKRDATGKEVKLVPLAQGATLQPGDEVEVQVSLRSKHQAEYVHLRDPRPAGFEPATTVSQYKWDLGIAWYEEVRDSGENFFFEALPVGEYTFKYRLRAALGGVFKAAPATVQALYAPEFVAYSSGAVVTIGPARQ